MSKLDDMVRFRIEELSTVLKAVKAVRPEVAEAVKASGSLSGPETTEVRERLEGLYAVLGASAEEYVRVLDQVLKRTGVEVRTIRPGVERRRSRKEPNGKLIA